MVIKRLLAAACLFYAHLQAMPALAAGWPAGLQLGMADAPGGAAAMKQTAPFGFRYQYLCAGVNTGSGWYTWNTNGDFVTYYVQNSIDQNITPVFTYYQIYQSLPGSTAGESQAVLANLQNTATMAAYFTDLKRFFQKAGAFPSTHIILHVEPDMWGYMQQKNGDNASATSVAVASSGTAELLALPNNASGFARAIVTLRDALAPNVFLGYHVSIWGTNVAIDYSDPADAVVDSLARRSAAFYNSLQANFDIAFGEFTDRDADFKRYQYGDNGASWWNAADFTRHARYFGAFSEAAHKRVVLWQIPYGNTKMRACNNTWGHYQDNRVEWLLDDATLAHLDSYLQTGVVAFLFGGGASGTTSASDAQADGITDPAPINGNTTLSLSADDDGGFFRQKAAAYYSRGAMTLPPGSPDPAVETTRTPLRPQVSAFRMVEGAALFEPGICEVTILNIAGQRLFHASRSGTDGHGLAWHYGDISGKAAAPGIHFAVLKRFDGSRGIARIPVVR